jgi:hypothetical protein
MGKKEKTIIEIETNKDDNRFKTDVTIFDISVIKIILKSWGEICKDKFKYTIAIFTTLKEEPFLVEFYDIEERDRVYKFIQDAVKEE